MGNLNNYMTFKDGALQPIFEVPLYQADGVTPYNLSQAVTAQFVMWAEFGTSLIINGALGNFTGTNNYIFQYQWNPVIWTPTAGRYLAEAQISFNGLSPLRMPLTGYWHIIVQPFLPPV